MITKLEDTKNEVDIHWLVAHIKDCSIRGITSTIFELIHNQKIAIGRKLPSVRALAELLGVSPATISAAWGVLRKKRVIAGKGRNGVWVCGQPPQRPERISQLGNFSGLDVLDLSWVVPDITLLPDCRQAIAQSTHVNNLHCYKRIPIIPELEQQVSVDWPYPAAAFMASNGGIEGINLLLQSSRLHGSIIAVEIPSLLLILDILEHLDIVIIPVRCDHQGPLPSDLKTALEHNPSAFIYQPRAHLLLGHTVSQQRSSEIADLLKKNSGLIIEYDMMGILSSQPMFSLGKYYPERTFHIRSYSRVYGSDLRLAVISGTKEAIHRIHTFRDFSYGWSSRILQSALAWLIQDQQTHQSIAHARETYCQRRKNLVDALIIRGISVGKQDGLGLWLKVPSEHYAIATFAARGVIVQPGSHYGDKSNSYVFINTSLLKPEQVNKVADIVALACENSEDNSHPFQTLQTLSAGKRLKRVIHKCNNK